jgi:hypothetical protein
MATQRLIEHSKKPIPQEIGPGADLGTGSQDTIPKICQSQGHGT